MASPPQSRTVERERRAWVLDRLLRAERARLMRQARFHSRRHEDAEDALNDACVQFLRFYDGPAGEEALHWMLLVIKRAAWAITRQATERDERYRLTAAEGLEIVAPHEGAGPAELVERTEESAQVIELIERLKPDERDALVLLGLGYSYAEIGELRGWGRAKVHRCLKEGRARVRQSLRRGPT
ncbi:MAG TPA: sigma-70 family RNA polymerase sigma factor [Solirubrobacterales bacterium]